MNDLCGVFTMSWDGNTGTWPLPEGTYAVKRNEADFSKIKYKPEEALTTVA
jgi:hypothetical protein